MNVRPDDSHSRSGKSTKAAATLAALLMLTAARTPDYKVQPASVPLLMALGPP